MKSNSDFVMFEVLINCVKMGLHKHNSTTESQHAHGHHGWMGITVNWCVEVGTKSAARAWGRYLSKNKSEEHYLTSHSLLHSTLMTICKGYLYWNIGFFSPWWLVLVICWDVINISGYQYSVDGWSAACNTRNHFYDLLFFVVRWLWGGIVGSWLC